MVFTNQNYVLSSKIKISDIKICACKEIGDHLTITAADRYNVFKDPCNII